MTHTLGRVRLGFVLLTLLLPMSARAQRVEVCAIEWLDPLRFEAILRVEVGPVEASFRVDGCSDTEVTLVVERADGTVSRRVRVDDTAPAVRPRLLALMLAELLRLPTEVVPPTTVAADARVPAPPGSYQVGEPSGRRDAFGLSFGRSTFPCGLTGAFRVAMNASIGRLLLGVQSHGTGATSSLGRIRLVAAALDAGVRAVDVGQGFRFQLDVVGSLGAVRARVVARERDLVAEVPDVRAQRDNFLMSPRRTLFLQSGLVLGIAARLPAGELSVRIHGGYTRGMRITEVGRVVVGFTGLTLGLTAGVDFTL